MVHAGLILQRNKLNLNGLLKVVMENSLSVVKFGNLVFNKLPVVLQPAMDVVVECNKMVMSTLKLLPVLMKA